MSLTSTVLLREETTLDRGKFDPAQEVSRHVVKKEHCMNTVPVMFCIFA
jgi:hypothetical protein